MSIVGHFSDLTGPAGDVCSEGKADFSDASADFRNP